MEHFLNKENDGNLSGNAYVAVRLKEDPLDKFGKIQIATPRLCGHINRICVECANSWYDYEFFWERTVGGRKLKEKLDAVGSN